MKSKKHSFLKLILAAALCLLVVMIVSVRMEMRSLAKEQETLSSLLEQRRQEIAELQNDLSLPREDYIEKYAREVLGYHKAGEFIFKFGS